MPVSVADTEVISESLGPAEDNDVVSPPSNPKQE